MLQSGARMQAEWRDCAVVGDVHYTFPSGSSYTGGYADNTMHGYGTFAGAMYTYVGHFEHGKKHGEGKITYTDGRTLEDSQRCWYRAAC